jgi:hypothetical protein
VCVCVCVCVCAHGHDPDDPLPPATHSYVQQKHPHSLLVGRLGHQAVVSGHGRELRVRKPQGATLQQEGESEAALAHGEPLTGAHTLP